MQAARKKRMDKWRESATQSFCGSLRVDAALTRCDQPLQRRQRIALCVVHVEPVGFGERVQAVRQSRLVALRATLTKLQRGRHGGAGGGRRSWMLQRL